MKYEREEARQAIRSYKCAGKKEKQKGTQERRMDCPEMVTRDKIPTLCCWENSTFAYGKSIIRALEMDKPHYWPSLNPAPPGRCHHAYKPLSISTPLDTPTPFAFYCTHCTPSMDRSTVYFYCRSPHVQYATGIRCQLDTHPIWIPPGQLHNWFLAVTTHYFQRIKTAHFSLLHFTLSPF